VFLFTVFIESRFSAAHRLVGYKGHCGRVHGHTWKVRVEVKTDRIDEIGISMDFKDLRSLTESVLSRLDHQNINEIPPFDKMNPTAENLSRHIFEEIGRQLPSGIRMAGVTVWESENHAVTYTDES
jgi:6-pyruvoyltetrahydropterin/6-carboxytetrahydropterin synthase